MPTYNIDHSEKARITDIILGGSESSAGMSAEARLLLAAWLTHLLTPELGGAIAMTGIPPVAASRIGR